MQGAGLNSPGAYVPNSKLLHLKELLIKSLITVQMHLLYSCYKVLLAIV